MKSKFLKKSKIKILIICRSKSKRLPNKIKKKINGFSIIEILIKRLLVKFEPKDIVICTSVLEKKKFFKDIKSKFKIDIFFGSDQNLFKRVLDCSKIINFSHFVRITGDNPLTCGDSIIKISQKHIKQKNDFTYVNSLPHGMRFEIISVKSLKKASILAVDPMSSEYMRYYFLRKTFKHKVFKLRKIYKDQNSKSITIDNKKDLSNLKSLIKKNIFLSSNRIIQNLKKRKNIRHPKKIIVKNDRYDVRLKNNDNNIIHYEKLI